MGFDMSIFRVDPPAYEEILAVRAERQRQASEFGEAGAAGRAAGIPVAPGMSINPVL